MRRSKAATEVRRRNDAIAETRYHLARFARDITSHTGNPSMRDPDPAKERRHAIGMVKPVAEELEEAAPPLEFWYYSIPDVKFCATILRAAIPALERTRPATVRGRSADRWRARNEAIVEMRKLPTSRSEIYQRIARGDLDAVKDGARTKITYDSVKRVAAALPKAKVRLYVRQPQRA